VSVPDDLDTYLRTERARIETALAHVLPPDAPAVIIEAMRYSLLVGGKRMRPILTLAAADTVARRLDPTGGTAHVTTELALPAACAIEMIHTYSLVHDDLPAMDNDSLRRGRPTSHVVFGEGMAILAGDGLLTEAFAVLAREPRGGVPAVDARKLRATAAIARAAGAAGMVGGQALDLQASPDMAAADLQGMHARKTGALIRAAATAGAIMAGGDDAMIDAVDTFASELGLAFQIVDDILDVEGEASTLGKTAGKDAAAGKPTYPALYGVDESRRLAKDCIARAHGALARPGLSGRLDQIADWVVQRSS
jgi:geranylgeranyl diphosphate synthase type II